MTNDAAPVTYGTQQHYGSALDAPRTPEGRLIPRIRPESERFWESCRLHAMELQRCRACNAFRYYPAPICPRCWSLEADWTPVSGNGVVYSYSWVHRPAPGFRDLVPYAYALVELEEGPVLPTNVVETTPDELRIGMDVAVDYLDLTDRISLPVFVPRQTGR